MADDEGHSQGTVLFQPLGAPPLIDDGAMEDLIEKLKLLNYETEFCPTNKPPFKLLGKAYFAVADSNPNAQFYYFTSLVSWLMTAAGHSGFPPPGQFDDPNATSTNVLEELKAMHLQTGNLAPNRIRAGHGEAVQTILALLVDKALIAKGFSFAAIDYPSEKAEDLDAADGGKDGGANVADDFIDDNIAVDSEEEDDEVFSSAPGKSKGQLEEQDAIVPQVSAEQWALEVERVGPQLQLRSDEIKDWRARIEVASTLLKAVEKMYPDVKTMLIRMGDDLDKNCDRIKSREQTLSQQFKEHVEEYRVKLRELSASQEEFNQVSSKVSGLTNDLNQVTEMLERTKSDIEDREAKISNTTPLMQIKDALAKVRSEIKQMSLRIGVLQHTVLHYNLRQAKEKREGRSNAAQQDESDFNEHEYSFNLS
eukprot:GILI01007947.1.p1 GENE.GILI01007947.1~~GILI01007947.1.p1  ORF type:complete len:423 (-),score=126.71 GILI01007947.1:68-1336(-)